MTERHLFARAVAAFLLLPGLVALAVPLFWLRPDSRGFSLAGAPFVIAGGAILLWCVREFYVAGRGTLAPSSPPRHLVVSGLYRLSRNPMYVGVLLMLAGWAVGFRSIALTAYAAAALVAFHLRVLLHEEPWLARTHGPAWHTYAARTPRWIGLPRDAGSGRAAA